MGKSLGVCDNVQPMFEIPSREDLAALAAKANAVAPTKTVGFIRPLDGHRVSVFGSTQNGIGEYVLPNADLASNSVFEWHLRSIGAQSFVSVPIAHSEPPVRFWAGLSDPNPLTKDQHDRIERIANETINLLNPSIPPDTVARRLRRLEITAELLKSI